MCGICGLIYADKSSRPDEQKLRRMNDAMSHRGPDDAGAWIHNNVALAMRRLSILDLSDGRQPMFSEDGSVAVVFNGEVYNFMSLRRELESLGHQFRTNSDTEVIVHAYESFGDDCLLRFNGMFALAIYDESRDRLLLARDRLGIKPLFYVHREGAVAFASELGSLIKSGLVRHEISPQALRDYFSFLYIPAPDTIYRDARKLRPGEKLVVEAGGVSVEKYWLPEYRIDPKWTLDSAAEEFLRLALSAVRMQHVGEVPLGAFLSGGIDSSTLVALMSRLGRVKTFTIGFDDAHADELTHARRVAQHFDTDHTEEIMRPDLTASLPALIAHFGEPFADSSAIPTWLAARLARRQVTAALSGDGGDELFAGYTWTRRTRDITRAAMLPRAAKQIFAAAVGYLPESPAKGRLERAVRQLLMEPREAFRMRETCFEPAALDALLRPEWNMAARDRFDEHAADGPADLCDWMLYQDTVMYLPDDILTKIDRMSMACSLEARVPLLDHRMVEFAATVPFGLKLRGKTSKLLVKHAMRDILPPETLVQRKQGFGIPIHRWFRQELRGYFQDIVLQNNAAVNEYVNARYVREIFDLHAAGKGDHGHHLWTLLVFELWLQ